MLNRNTNMCGRLRRFVVLRCSAYIATALLLDGHSLSSWFMIPAAAYGRRATDPGLTGDIRTANCLEPDRRLMSWSNQLNTARPVTD